MSNATSEPQPVASKDEPEHIAESATGDVVSDGASAEHLTGEEQAKENAENDPPA